MSLEVKDIPAKITPYALKAKKYTTLIFTVSLALIFGFLIASINNYSKLEPTEEAVTEKLTTVQRPKIDENALNKIQQLEDQNIEVQTLFKQARDNPFSE